MALGEGHQTGAPRNSDGFSQGKSCCQPNRNRQQDAAKEHFDWQGRMAGEGVKFRNLRKGGDKELYLTDVGFY